MKNPLPVLLVWLSQTPAAIRRVPGVAPACRGAAAVYGWVKTNFFRWNELYLLAVLVLWWPASQTLLLDLNPAAAPLPFDTLHKLYLTGLVFAGSRAFLYVGTRINQPWHYNYNEKESSKEFTTQLTAWQRQIVYLWVYSVDLLCFALIWQGSVLNG